MSHEQMTPKNILRILMTSQQDAVISAEDGLVVYRMTPWLADQLSMLLPTNDTGWANDSALLLEAAYIAKGNGIPTNEHHA